MERREAVKYISLLLGGTVIGADAFLSGCRNKGASNIADLTAEDIAYLNEVGETILPRTATPGAKDARVGEFMQVMVRDCYEEADQRAFMDGLGKLNDASREKFKNDFMSITPEQRTQLLTEIDAEAKAYQKEVSAFNNEENQKAKDEEAKGNRDYKRQHKAPHYYTMMKQLTLLGFFTSEPGMTQAVRYLPVPGRYEGCVPYTKGDKVIV
jgi:hypothetical protein